jgi:hypothetical protein
MDAAELVESTGNELAAELVPAAVSSAAAPPAGGR